MDIVVLLFIVLFAVAAVIIAIVVINTRKRGREAEQEAKQRAGEKKRQQLEGKRRKADEERKGLENEAQQNAKEEEQKSLAAELQKAERERHKAEEERKHLDEEARRKPELPRQIEELRKAEEERRKAEEEYKSREEGTRHKEEEAQRTEEEDERPKVKAERKPLDPGKRGGRPSGLTQGGEERSAQETKSLRSKPEISCWKRERRWILGVEIPDDLLQKPELQVLQNGSPLTQDESSEGCWCLEHVCGQVVVQWNEDAVAKETQIALGEGNHLLFKLCGENQNLGRRVKSSSLGPYLVVVMDNWARDEALSGPPPADPEPVSLAGYRAHFFDLEKDGDRKIVFRAPGGESFVIESKASRFELFGARLNDANEDIGPLFGGSPPKIRTVGYQAWTDVDCIVVLEEGKRSEEKRWREMIAPDEEAGELGLGDLGLQGWQARVLMNEKGKLKKGEKRWSGKTGKRARFLTKLLMRTGISEQEAVEQAVTALRDVWETVRRYDENAPSSHDRLLIPVDDARRLNPDWWRLSLIRNDDTIFQCDTCGRLQGVSIHTVCPRHRCPGTLKEEHWQNLEPNHYRLLYEEDLPGTLRVEEHTAQLDKEKAREFQREFRNGNIHVLSCSTTFELGVDLGDLDTIFLRNVPPEAFNYVQRVGRAGRRSGYPGFAITYCRRGPHDLYHFSEPERMLRGRVRPPVLSLRNEKIITRHVVATGLSQFFGIYPERFKSNEDRTSHVQRLFRDLEKPSGIADFRAFLHKNQTKLEQTLIAIVPSDPYVVAEVGLNDGSWIEKIAGNESRFSIAEAEVSSDYKNVKDLERVSAQKGTQEGYKTAEWANARAKTISEEDIPSFLSRKAVIPKYGFPVDVVELDTQKTQQNQEAFEVLLQRDLSIAIAEFAPTSKLVANKKLWTSYGLKRVAEKEWDRWWYVRCAVHNRFERKPYQKEEHPPSFEKCCGQMVIYQYIDPKFGFVTTRDKPDEPKARPPKVFTTRPYFAGFKDKEGDKIDFDIITLTTVSPGYMVVLCEGRRGEGFYVCGQCGAGFRKRENTHKTPYGQDCRGSLKQVSLGYEFVTDVLQLQFHPKPQEGIEPVWFAYSLAYAVVEGAAEVLEVPSTDLSATVAHSEQYPVPPIILYDNVPGGAGLVAQLEREEMLQKCLEIARKRVSNCSGCVENSSCYSCLRSYRNQFAHQYLQRGPVMHYLEVLLSKWK